MDHVENVICKLAGIYRLEHADQAPFSIKYELQLKR